MKDTLVALGYLLGLGVVLSVGLCLLISPRYFFVLQDRLARTRIWSEHAPTWDAGSGLRWRVLGLFLVLISLFMLIAPFIKGRVPRAIDEQSMNTLLDAPRTVGSHLGSLLFLLLFLGLGLSFVIKPNSTVNWVAPRQALTNEQQAQRSRVLRVFGTVLILVALFEFYLTLHR